MATVTLDDLRKYTDADLKNINKQKIIEIIRNSPAPPEVSTDLSSDIKSLTAAIAALQKDLATFKADQKATSATVVDLNAKCVLLEERYRVLENKMLDLEQRSRVLNVGVVGINGKSDDENEDQALSLFEEMGVPMTAMDIEACHVVPTRRRDKRAPVIVAFTNRKWKERVLAKKKELFAINRDREPSDRRYVNEHLSPHNKRIYLSCLSVKCKNDNNDPQRVYKYVWTKKGVTFLRKDEEGARAIRVDSIDKAIELGITILDD